MRVQAADNPSGHVPVRGPDPITAREPLPTNCRP
jgi:hypothetical protein